jgi:hypothetical protein
MRPAVQRVGSCFVGRRAHAVNATADDHPAIAGTVGDVIVAVEGVRLPGKGPVVLGRFSLSSSVALRSPQ